ncbi:sulfatase-like hydrolase/transferase, partial [Microvirga sp. 3-52]|nr:sulfatase-like hydrolase/transferase [Microvirga sp. 3-52]
PPSAFYDMYRDVDIPDSPIGDWANTEDEGLEGYSPITAKGIVPERRLKQAKAAYYALITHIDHQIGRFLNAMQEYGVYQDTIILFVSDHGELLGDHNLFRKSLPYEGSANVPFILVDPGNHLQMKKNVKIDEMVELRDIMPTLLDATNITIPNTVEGKSVLPLVKMESTENLSWREYIHGEHTLGIQSYHSITSGEEKYIWYSQTGEEQFFNLIEDPQELTNLIHVTDYGKRINLRRNQLIEELTGREEGYTDGKSLI